MSSSTDYQELEAVARRGRWLAISTVAGSGAGHVGGPFSAMDIMVALYFSVMKVNPEEPKWPERDRFILSKGHSSIGQYVVMALRGFLPIEELKTFDKGGSQLGSVAALQVARDRLAGCSSWPLRFAVYSSGGNLSRRSSCWQWDGTCAFPFRTATSRSCSPSGVCTPITSRYGDGYSATPQRWNDVCARGSNRPTTVGGWTRPTSGLRASGCIYTGLSTPPARRSTSFYRLNATQRPLSASSPKRWAGRTIRRRG